ncbi:hypothetical protein J437_LFUL007063 [Ladona fulva]|uniref:Uncharacterized protein n=1 Tax=Ladona fulva TaxID=123851 RepID=A0A8K0K6C4_LADFU|nr:hypothetical protein J437_LFUL007063 [Ladona fulva]
MSWTKSVKFTSMKSTIKWLSARRHSPRKSCCPRTWPKQEPPEGELTILCGLWELCLTDFPRQPTRHMQLAEAIPGIQVLDYHTRQVWLGSYQITEFFSANMLTSIWWAIREKRWLYALQFLPPFCSQNSRFPQHPAHRCYI